MKCTYGLKIGMVLRCPAESCTFQLPHTARGLRCTHKALVIISHHPSPTSQPKAWIQRLQDACLHQLPQWQLAASTEAATEHINIPNHIHTALSPAPCRAHHQGWYHSTATEWCCHLQPETSTLKMHAKEVAIYNVITSKITGQQEVPLHSSDQEDNRLSAS